MANPFESFEAFGGQSPEEGPAVAERESPEQRERTESTVEQYEREACREVCKQFQNELQREMDGELSVEK
jgi:hypothetical protein